MLLGRVDGGAVPAASVGPAPTDAPQSIAAIMTAAGLRTIQFAEIGMFDFSYVVSPLVISRVASV